MDISSGGKAVRRERPERCAAFTEGPGGRRWVSLALGLLVLASTVFVVLPARRARGAPHAPILILGDANFTAANGVTSGSGTETDPYVIEGWEIDATNENAIHIYATTAHFVIRNVSVSIANGAVDTGIRLQSVSDGRIEDVVATNFSGPVRGIWITASSRVTVSRASVSGTAAVGVLVEGSENVTLVDNNVSANSGPGIVVSNAKNTTIARNLVAGNLRGISLQWDSSGVVRRNEVRDNQQFGIRFFFNSGDNVSVHHNAISNNTPQAEDDGTGDRWDNGYPAGGNYWSDYAGADACSGPAQDVCPDPDGIGDTPYVIDADSRDRYPLMAPPDLGDDPPGPPALSSATLAGAGDADVRLDWLPSPDDGAGARDVVAYEVWSGTAYDPAGASYALAATVPAGTTNATLAGQGHGDPADRFYAVRAVDEDARVGNASQQAAKLARFLTAGDQLLSVPLEPADASVPAVLRTLPWTRARAYDAAAGAWTAAIPGRPATLSALNRTTGFWVNVSADAWWTVAGLLPARTDVPLRAGWNLVAYPSVLPRNVSDALGGAPYDAVEGWAAVAPYHLARLAPGDAMAAGRGYWVHATADATVTITN